jgi:hypothetical protein
MVVLVSMTVLVRVAVAVTVEKAVGGATVTVVAVMPQHEQAERYSDMPAHGLA